MSTTAVDAASEAAARRPLPVFPNYTQLPTSVSQPTWTLVRSVTVGGVIGIVITLVVDEDVGLPLFWGVVVPVLPALWLLAPGLWRNACPLAAANQLPRITDRSRGLTTPAWFKRFQYAFGMTAFVALVATRRVLFNRSGLATALLLLAVFSLALAGGVVFKGKSGWCSSICPLLPIQRLYGQTPAVTVPNAHCQPCVGCTKNCYDFNPGVAQFADLHDPDEEYAGFRRAFAGLLPGLVVGFFEVPAVTEVGVWGVYGRMGLAVLVSLGAYNLLRALLVRQTVVLTALFGAVAINLFYGYGATVVAASLQTLTAWRPPDELLWALRGGIAVASAAFVVRTARRERQYLVADTSVVRVARPDALRRAAADADHEVIFEPSGADVGAHDGDTVLVLAERLGLDVEPGCRMGVCGADPVAVIDGAEHLSAATDDEESTLDRLGLLGSCRMACVARVHGSVTVSLDTSSAPQAPTPTGPAEGLDPDVRRVVVLGNGIAGVTAVDHARRLNPDVEIHLVSREVHHLYNRMGISRMVYGRTAMHGLFLNPEAWYDDRGVALWLNTVASRIDRDAKQVHLGTGDVLDYDRLVIATGAHAWVPPIDGWGLPGCFVLREAEDAAALRGYAQEHGLGECVVAGGGLLGLEAAYALRKLGLAPTVLDIGDRLLRRQLDVGASTLLRDYLERLGIRIRLEASVTAVVAGDSGRLDEVVLGDGAVLATGMLLVAAGVRPNLAIAEAAGLACDRGIVIDDRGFTNDPAILACGDVAAHRGRSYGLWPAAVDQARVAGRNAVLLADHHDTYEGTVAVTMLKVAGIDLVSMGRIEVGEDDEELVEVDIDGERYRKLVVDAGGRLAGAILLGHPDLAPVVTPAVKEGRDVTAVLDDLRRGDLAALA